MIDWLEKTGRRLLLHGRCAMPGIFDLPAAYSSLLRDPESLLTEIIAATMRDETDAVEAELREESVRARPPQMALPEPRAGILSYPNSNKPSSPGVATEPFQPDTPKQKQMQDMALKDLGATGSLRPAVLLPPSAQSQTLNPSIPVSRGSDSQSHRGVDFTERPGQIHREPERRADSTLVAAQVAMSTHAPPLYHAETVNEHRPPLRSHELAGRSNAAPVRMALTITALTRLLTANVAIAVQPPVVTSQPSTTPVSVDALADELERRWQLEYLRFYGTSRGVPGG